MDPRRWQRIKEVFSAALEVPPEERTAWLSAALPDDPSLAGEVTELLGAHLGGSGDFYERGALAALPDLNRQLQGAAGGMRLGPYRVLSEIGRGGMGAVYLAVRDEPRFTQKVAIKLIKRGMDTDQIVRRFLAERQILASLAHPNIARLLDGGSTPDGLPYFVMEYVEGRPITAYAEEQKLGLEARLQLFQSVCGAVQSAHQSLVVHRDLKPANILVDASGEPKLLDFGIAKLLDPTSFGGLTALTGLAPGPMTPDYASPEQLAGGPITTATDVYGLGLLLYELLVGLSPRAVAQRLGPGWADRLPSQALAALAASADATENTEKRRLAHRLQGDLDTILGKALAPEPERRYGTAAALGEDIARYLTQRPVAARRPTLSYRLGRTLLRHKLAAALALGVCLLAVYASVQTFLVLQESQREAAQRRRAEVLNDFLQNMMRRANPEKSRGRTLTVRQMLDLGAQELAASTLRRDPETWAALLETVGDTYADLGFYDEARRYLEQALALRQKQRNPSREAALELAGNWSLLGSVALAQERLPASRDAYQRALALRTRELSGRADLSRVRDWNGLGRVALAFQDVPTAERYLTQAWAASRAAPEGQRELAETLNNLGQLAADRGQYPRAQVFFQAALGQFRKTLGDDHPDTIKVRSNLAFILYHRADYAAAESLYQETVDLRRRLLGPDHPDLARALLELAIVQRRCGHLAAARANLDELLKIRREHRFPLNEDEAETWKLLGYIALDQHQLDTAENAMEKCFEVYRSLPGEHRTDLADALAGQARVRRERADLPGALALARRSLGLARAALGASHPKLAASWSLLAELAQQTGDLRGAEADYRQALALRAGSEWADHPEKARALIGLGSLLTATGRANEARPYLEEGLRIERKALPARDPAIARAQSELGACYAALGDGRARELLEQGYRGLAATEGPDHPETRKAADRLRRLAPPAA
ncbi:MAG TPA: tetratricopeptide repeat protein [Thermoanaerobaculia bacterium]|nr:tetratricopeptide repeat protein [Thermoanaerobaculia bacterium]